MAGLSAIQPVFLHEHLRRVAQPILQQSLSCFVRNLWFSEQ
jgi:hypothetical protein